MSTRILLALPSPELARVIEHLLSDLPDTQIVDRATTSDTACRGVAWLAPDVIVASTRVLGRDGMQDLKRFSPGSKLIVITSGAEWGLADSRAGSADASLDEEDLVRGLLPILHTLV